MIFLDTNALLNCNYDPTKKFTISSVTLQELENIKCDRRKDESTRADARAAVNWLNENPDKYNVVVFTDDIDAIITEKKVEHTPDTKICATASWLVRNGEYVTFVTNDGVCRTFARDVFGLDVVDKPEHVRSAYTGYKEVQMTDEQLSYFYSHMSDNQYDLVTNQYIIITDKDGVEVDAMRWDGEKHVCLKYPNKKIIKPKNVLQRCALDMLTNNDITVCAVLGSYGSGKSYLALRMALYAVKDKGNQSKVLGVREVLGEGEEIGFLPGEMDNKVGPFFLPLVQQLDGGEFELQSLKQSGMLEVNIPYFMKGTTYQDTVMVVDEAEDLTKKQIKLVGTRVGENSRIFFAGDYKQSVINSSTNNPLLKMCEEFKGDPRFACVYLGEDVRSDTSKMFAGLFE